MISLVEWAEHFIILPSGQHIRFEDHQKAIFNHVFTFDEGDRLPYDTIVYSAPKKSGKTTINGIVMGYWLYNIEPPNEVICVANKKDQAIARGFSELKGYVRADPTLLAEATSITGSQIRLQNGSTVLAIPNNYQGEAGSNHGLTTWDELWGFSNEADRRLYDEFTGVPTRRNSVRLITTYAGFEGESELLEDLYHKIFDDKHNVKPGVKRPLGKKFPAYAKGELFVYWDHKPRMAWQTKRYYRSQKQQLRPNTYLRLHENRWTSSESGLFDMDKWDGCVSYWHKPPLPDKSIKLSVGVDASTKRDRAAVVSTYREGDKLKLGPKRFWQPSKKEPLDLELTMEKYLLELHANYTLTCVRYDPWQFHRSGTTLRKKGLPVEEFPQTEGNLTEAGQGLFDLIEYGNIVLYRCKDMRYEATCALAKETSRGLRIVKGKSSQKIDQIIGLAMASLPPARQRVVPRVGVVDTDNPPPKPLLKQKPPEGDYVEVWDGQGFAGYEKITPVKMPKIPFDDRDSSEPSWFK